MIFETSRRVERVRSTSVVNLTLEPVPFFFPLRGTVVHHAAAAVACGVECHRVPVESFPWLPVLSGTDIHPTGPNLSTHCAVAFSSPLPTLRTHIRTQPANKREQRRLPPYGPRSPSDHPPPPRPSFPCVCACVSAGPVRHHEPHARTRAKGLRC